MYYVPGTNRRLLFLGALNEEKGAPDWIKLKKNLRGIGNKRSNDLLLQREFEGGGRVTRRFL